MSINILGQDYGLNPIQNTINSINSVGSQYANGAQAAGNALLHFAAGGARLR